MSPFPGRPHSPILSQMLRATVTSLGSLPRGPGGHSITVEALRQPNVRRVWGLVELDILGGVGERQVCRPRDSDRRNKWLQQGRLSVIKHIGIGQDVTGRDSPAGTAPASSES